jgi:predicted ribosome quality control (RQC) complex YloA/Tae2 family protein
MAQGELAFTRKKEQLQRTVANAMSRLRSKMTALQQQQAATEKAEATRKQADLLAANLYKCQRGDSKVEVLVIHLA